MQRAAYARAIKLMNQSGSMAARPLELETMLDEPQLMSSICSGARSWFHPQWHKVRVGHS